MFNGRERRKYKRIEGPINARLRIKQYNGLKSSSAEWDIVALKDLSAGGARFNYNRNIKINSLLDLKLDVSTAIPTIKCAGKVTRIEKSGSDSILFIATEFREIEENDKEIISTNIEET